MRNRIIRLSITMVAVLLAAGIAQAQTLVLSDNFDTGGVATTNLNYNQVARQSGTSAPLNFHSVYTNSMTLHAGGYLDMQGSGVARTDPFSPQIGNESFSIKVKGRHHYFATAEWTMLSVQSATNDNWEISPININLWNHGVIHIYSGAYTGTSTNIIMQAFSSNDVAVAIGGPYDAGAVHTYEIRTFAQSATNGTFGFYVDDAALATELPYTFGDANLQFAWVPTGTELAETSWDDLEISTILPLVKVVGVGDAGYSETGSWTDTSLGYSTAMKFDTTSLDATASWSFSDLSNGFYSVYATWDPLSNRSTNAPYASTDGMASITVNQRVAPFANLVLNNGITNYNFQKLGIVEISDGDFTITLSSDGVGGADTFVIADAVALVPTIDSYVVNISDDGFSQTGFTDGGYLYFANDGNAGASASWTFSGLADDTYDVVATWVELSNRSTEAPYSFSEGLATVTINQRIAPGADYQIDGADLQKLGQVTITGGVFTVTLTDDASTNLQTFVIAQAVALVPAAVAVIIDNGDTGYSEASSTWNTWQGLGEYGTNFRYTSAPVDPSASYAFTGLANGWYNAYATWPSNPAASPSVPYTGTDGFAATTADQQLAPSADFTDSGVNFQRLGFVSITDTDLTGTVGYGGGQLRADAMALVWTDTYTIGYNDGGFSQTGFTSAGTFGYANDGGSPASASWTFSNLASGEYEVSASWVGDFNRSLVSPFTLSDGGGLVEVDQRNNSMSVLGTVTVTDGEFVVSLTDDASLDVATWVIAESVSLTVIPEPATLG
ncbi:hypothetical protein DRQ53_14630, partial [bacterium]